MLGDAVVASSPLKPCRSVENRGTYGFYVFMLSFGLFGSKTIGACLESVSGFIFILESFLYIVVSWSKNLITFFLSIPLRLFIVIHGRFFFLMRTT